MSTINSKRNTSGSVEKSDNSRGKKVYVGMSGGVDSSVSALLLKRAGYDVTGVFIKVWQPDGSDCGWKDERRDAMRVAAVLNIPFKTFDFSLQYKKEVVDYMISEYGAGRTPNPDIMCNRHVKFGSFLKKALEDGVDFVATGHYAQNAFDKDTQKWCMTESADKEKDQTYFLWTLNQDDLAHVLFPIGHLEKKDVRQLAEKYDLPVFDKKDSQGVCFIGHLDIKAFLKENIKTEKGKVLDTAGNIIGEHDGAVLYTLGERHGFKLFTKIDNTKTHYIIEKNIENNTITVADASEYQEKVEELVSKEIDLERVNIIGDNINDILEKDVYARIRYRQDKQKIKIVKKSDKSVDKFVAVFDKAQKGMAKGQSIVFYEKLDGGKCLGGAIIS